MSGWILWDDLANKILSKFFYIEVPGTNCGIENRKQEDESLTIKEMERQWKIPTAVSDIEGRRSGFKNTYIFKAAVIMVTAATEIALVV